jgi:hypothetical protein
MFQSDAYLHSMLYHIRGDWNGDNATDLDEVTDYLMHRIH